MRLRCAALVVFSLLTLDFPLAAQERREYRAYWAETFNTQLGTHADIDRLIQNCVDSNCNAIFAQVRRRGDSWYLNTLEPLTQVAGVGEPDGTGTWTFDPLTYLVQQAHARNIEVHAFVIIGAIYNAHPTLTGLPRDPNHVFNQHFWNRTASALLPNSDPAMWSTRSLPHHTDGTTFEGRRYTNGEWYVDLGHPDAAAYTVEVLNHLVANYDVDGIHLDRIRYPEAPIDRVSGTPTGINVGYNETSVLRFKARFPSTGLYTTADIGKVANTTPERKIVAGDVGYPKTNDALWNQWRRDQVTNFVRRLYLTVSETKPQIKVSAALICFWTGPVASPGWNNTEAYYRVFQDWKAWTEEGILDIVAPMDYKREHNTTERNQFEDWMSFTKTLAANNGRHSMIGLGVYLNGIEGSLRQSRRVLGRPPYESLPQADGVIFYALGSTIPGVGTHSTNEAVTNNPFSYPTPNITTPKRPNASFFSGVRLGSAGATLFEPTTLTPLFTGTTTTPEMPWKSGAATVGHVKGFVSGLANADGASVTIRSEDGSFNRTVLTDGGGFYGALKLAPGRYRATSTRDGLTVYSYPFDIAAGLVTHADVIADTVAPEITIDSPIDGGTYVHGQSVAASFSCSDALSGVATCAGAATVDTLGAGAKSYTANATDNAGNSSSKTVSYTIIKAGTVTTVTADVSRNSVTFTATVSVVEPGGGTPTGEIVFEEKYENQEFLGSAPLVDGVATITVQKRAYKMTASYSGSDDYEPSTTGEFHFTPNP